MLEAIAPGMQPTRMTPIRNAESSNPREIIQAVNGMMVYCPIKPTRGLPGDPKKSLPLFRPNEGTNHYHCDGESWSKEGLHHKNNVRKAKVAEITIPSRTAKDSPSRIHPAK